MIRGRQTFDEILFRVDDVAMAFEFRIAQVSRTRGFVEGQHFLYEGQGKQTMFFTARGILHAAYELMGTLIPATLYLLELVCDEGLQTLYKYGTTLDFSRRFETHEEMIPKVSEGKYRVKCAIKIVLADHYHGYTIETEFKKYLQKNGLHHTETWGQELCILNGSDLEAALAEMDRLEAKYFHPDLPQGDIYDVEEFEQQLKHLLKMM